MWKKVILSVLVVTAVGALAAGCFTSRAGYATAPYTVRSTDGPFEIRDYPSLQIAATPTGADGSDNGFMRLFHYISGDNSDNGKISMTTPVFMIPGATQEMAFVLPESYRTNRPPQPKESSVQVRELPPRRFAVYRFTGYRRPETEAEARKQLESWLQKVKLVGDGDPVYAYFDPPWTPSFLRRNEVMLPLKPNLP